MKTILVVDDDFQLRDLLKKAFAQIGYIVLTATNGNKAIKTLSQVNIDLAIVDMIMPETDGVETISLIRKKYPSVSVIAISGGSVALNSDLLTEIALKVGADYALRKPFDLEELTDKVNTCLISEHRQLRLAN